ncbi:hypothetical protein QTG54_006455 [Skeletonema marinoi]|uniref:Uncharacterized protein n=1 Tax=Skeletonema marinoi TaxID=267567 RepID=A0AAD9DEL9_9STRA|nr:hypothetical protein QTG54_006455 [Skeletonema marinoi]
MNLIKRLHLLAAASRDIALNRARNLELATGDTTEVVTTGNAACGFNFTDEFLADGNNTEVYTYKAGEVCSYALTTVSYITEPLSAVFSQGDDSNIASVKGAHRLAVMKSDELGKFYCIEDAVTLSNSTQYKNGTATFNITGGEVAVTTTSIGAWTTVDVNGGSSMDVPGFYYVQDGFALGNVIFLDEEKILTEANYTKIQGTFTDLCEETNPPPSSAVAKNALLVISAMLPASVLLLL